MSPLNTDVVYIRLSSKLSVLAYRTEAGLQLSDTLNVCWIANGMMHQLSQSLHPRVPQVKHLPHCRLICWHLSWKPPGQQLPLRSRQLQPRGRWQQATSKHLMAPSLKLRHLQFWSKQPALVVHVVDSGKEDQRHKHLIAKLQGT